MPENTTDFRKALGAIIEARGREATRTGGAVRRDQLLIGSFTKRPN
jgi:hypothetical protein